MGPVDMQEHEIIMTPRKIEVNQSRRDTTVIEFKHAFRREKHPCICAKIFHAPCQVT